jgi:hypothetical protein
MGDESIVTLRYPPRQINHRDNEPMTHQNAVRVYRQSPDTVVLQIRREKQVLTATLNFEQAAQVANGLLKAAKEEQ